MPFEYFRSHQRKILVGLAILAMFSFVVADSLPRLFSDRPTGRTRDEVVANLKTGKVWQSDLDGVASDRTLANFVLVQMPLYAQLAQLRPDLYPPQPFGAVSPEALVDAKILEKEADDLGIPDTPEYGKTWLYDFMERVYSDEIIRMFMRSNNTTMGPSDTADALERIFEQYYSKTMTERDFLAAIARQARLLQVQTLAGQPLVTPLDSYASYRDDQENVSANYVAFPVADYLEKVKQPTDADLNAFYTAHKDQVADPRSGKPGFKLPRRVEVEFLTLDLAAVEALRDLVRQDPSFRKDLLEEAKAEIQARFPGETTLPLSLFAGDADSKLTPPSAEVEQRLIEDRLQTRVAELFEPIREKMTAFADTLDAESEDGRAASKVQAPSLKELAGDAAAKGELAVTKVVLTPELTDPLATPNMQEPFLALTGQTWAPEQAERVRQVVQASRGLGAYERPQFALEIFGRDSILFDPIDLVDPLGRRSLAWRTRDEAEAVAPFETVKAEVTRQWKLDQARTLAEADAKALAEKARNEPVKEGDQVVRLDLAKAAGDRQVKTTAPRPRSREVYDLPNAGPALRDALYGLQADSAVVAWDEPRLISYVLTLANREAVDFGRVFSMLPTYRTDAQREAVARKANGWITSLREKAGLPADWKPPTPDAADSEG